MKTIGNILREKRTAKHLSRAKLGEIIGVSGKSIKFWESGRCYPNALALCGIADALECTADELLGRKRK